jgi:hypothetical protein
MLLAQLPCLSALLRQLPMQFTTSTLLLFKRLLQIQQCGARLDALLLQLILQLLPAYQPQQAFLGEAVTIPRHCLAVDQQVVMVGLQGIMA